MEWVGPLQLHSHLVQRGTKRLWVELTKILKCQFMQIIRFLLQYLWRCQNVISFFIFFLLFLYIHIFCFFLLSIAFSWFIRALPVYAWFKFTCCLPTPGQRPGQVQPFRPGGGGSCPGGRGLGQIKNYLLFDFAQYVSFLVLFTRWLRTSRLRIFKEKRRNFSESGWRGITYQN